MTKSPSSSSNSSDSADSAGSSSDFDQSDLSSRTSPLTLSSLPALPLPVFAANDKLANRVIWIFSAIVFAVVAGLGRVQITPPVEMDIHLFAKLNAGINSLVTLLLLAGLVTAKQRRWQMHRRIMMLSILLSACFLVSYIMHHILAGETRFGGQGMLRWIYYSILISHIFLAAGSLPFILLTAYRALSGQYPQHARVARKIWPVWFYVSLSGVIVYYLISPYYQSI